MKSLSASALALLAACFCAAICWSPPSEAQRDPIQEQAKAVQEATGGKLAVTLEERTRWEERYGVNFGKDVNQQDMLSRLRIGAVYKPVSWFTAAAAGQDARAPFYGKPAPASMRDSIDLQEAWISFGSAKTPINFSAGRRVFLYGENRVIGIPQWGNTSRTYDHARLEYSSKSMSLAALLVSPVCIRPDAFNTPELGHRLWGTYNIFPTVWRGSSVDLYALRHSQNKIGGWSGPGTLGTNSLGARFYGPLPARFRYSLEGIAQNGHLGKLDQRAFAWFAGAGRNVNLGSLPLDSWVEYKQASGSHAGSSHSATYDQLAAANHDIFGHMDLFGWRNLKTFRIQETLHPTQKLAFNLIYSRESLFSPSDALYNSAGSRIAISPKGTAGAFVGQELDSFVTFKTGAHTFYAGFGHFFKGEFINHATPAINPRYFYIAQQYTIK